MDELRPQAGVEALARLRVAHADGRLHSLAEKHGLSLVVLFGSAADPEVTDPSDVDLAVAWLGHGQRDLVALVTDLMRLLGDAVDVLDLDRGGSVVRQRALTRGELLIEHEPGAFATRQMHAVKEYMETRAFRDLLLKSFAS